MTIETSHRGKRIRFNDNSEEWICSEIDFSHSSLAKVKDKINRVALAERKSSSVPAIEISAIRHVDLACETTVIEYVEPEVRSISGSLYRRNQQVVADHRVAVTTGKGGRQKRRLSDLAPSTEEALAMIEVAEGIRKQIASLEKAHSDAVKAIPRLTLDDISELVKVSGVDPTAGIEGESDG